MIISIGKTHDNDYVADDPQVSRHHARLVSEPDGSWLLEDLASTNGTFVNDIQVIRKRITKADQIRLGEHYTLSLAALLKAGWQGKFLHRAVEVNVLPHAKVPEIRSRLKLDAASLAAAVKEVSL